MKNPKEKSNGGVGTQQCQTTQACKPPLRKSGQYAAQIHGPVKRLAI